jgi:hypothetical protein
MEMSKRYRPVTFAVLPTGPDAVTLESSSTCSLGASSAGGWSRDRRRNRRSPGQGDGAPRLDVAAVGELNTRSRTADARDKMPEARFLLDRPTETIRESPVQQPMDTLAAKVYFADRRRHRRHGQPIHAAFLRAAQASFYHLKTEFKAESRFRRKVKSWRAHLPPEDAEIVDRIVDARQTDVHQKNVPLDLRVEVVPAERMANVRHLSFDRLVSRPEGLMFIISDLLDACWMGAPRNLGSGSKASGFIGAP